jgi:hypothetical protein
LGKGEALNDLYCRDSLQLRACAAQFVLHLLQHTTILQRQKMAEAIIRSDT